MLFFIISSHRSIKSANSLLLLTNGVAAFTLTHIFVFNRECLSFHMIILPGFLKQDFGSFLGSFYLKPRGDPFWLSFTILIFTVRRMSRCAFSSSNNPRG